MRLNSAIRASLVAMSHNGSEKIQRRVGATCRTCYTCSTLRMSDRGRDDPWRKAKRRATKKRRSQNLTSRKAADRLTNNRKERVAKPSPRSRRNPDWARVIEPRGKRGSSNHKTRTIAPPVALIRRDRVHARSNLLRLARSELSNTGPLASRVMIEVRRCRRSQIVCGSRTERSFGLH